MRLEDLLKVLEGNYDLFLYNNDYMLCKTTTDNKLLDMFTACEVKSWKPVNHDSLKINIVSEVDANE